MSYDETADSRIDRRPAVLVIDDQPNACEFMGRALRAGGFRVHTLSTPIGATRTAMRNNVQAVVMDLMMPAMSGDKLAALFRGTSRLSTIPLIFVSGADAQHVQEIADRFDAFMVAKRDVSELLAPTVAKAIARVGGVALVG